MIEKASNEKGKCQRLVVTGNETPKLTLCTMTGHCLIEDAQSAGEPVLYPTSGCETPKRDNEAL